MNRFSTGKYYPTYMFLWADLLAEDAEEARIQGYVDAYQNSKVDKKHFCQPPKSVISRLDDLDLESFTRADTIKANVLKEQVSHIQRDLQDLYNSLNPFLDCSLPKL